MIQAGALVNGSSILREKTVPEVFVYYHIELEDHALILANNVASETFVDNVDRLDFDNWQEHEALYPDGATVNEMPYPRAKAARQVPRAIRQMLDDRTQRLCAKPTVRVGPPYRLWRYVGSAPSYWKEAC